RRPGRPGGGRLRRRPRVHSARSRGGDHRGAQDPDHRHRRRRALRRPGAGAPRPPRPLDRLDPALRQALRGARPGGGARGRDLRARGEGRDLPHRGAGLRPAEDVDGSGMTTVTEPRAMQAWADAERGAGRRIALVPTMGALHAGHLALVAAARRRAQRVVVSIFVNPIQFDRRDDFERYPRTLDDDLRICATAGVDAVYAPSAAAMYAEGFQTAVEVTRLTEPLCGAARPGHFRGVTTVVTKLFHAVRPDVAVFGEKDYQQLAGERRARLEYAELRDPETLAELAEVAGPALLAVAVWVGGVRLIDNRLLVPEGDVP